MPLWLWCLASFVAGAVATTGVGLVILVGYAKAMSD